MAWKFLAIIGFLGYVVASSWYARRRRAPGRWVVGLGIVTLGLFLGATVWDLLSR